MGNVRWLRSVLLILLAAASGCVSGKVLTLPGGLSRPPGGGPAQAAGSPAVAVLDFTREGAAPAEIGRDYDHVRTIVWSGSPGKDMADLVAASLAEKGVPAVRAAGEGDVPPGIPARVRGRIDAFAVDVKRINTVKAEAAATVAVTLFADAPGVRAGWSSAVSSSSRNTTPLFLPPDGVLQALNGAANAVADEAARRLMEAGIAAKQ